MNTNDLPPAAKLAALIEAGRAANPDIEQGKGSLRPTPVSACALGFAALALGMPRNCCMDEAAEKADPLFVSAGFIGGYRRGNGLIEGVFLLNDRGASVAEIVRSLREGELAKVAV
jgi:hypothetical protein